LHRIATPIWNRIAEDQDIKTVKYQKRMALDDEELDEELEEEANRLEE